MNASHSEDRRLDDERIRGPSFEVQRRNASEGKHGEGAVGPAQTYVVSERRVLPPPAGRRISKRGVERSATG